MNQFKKCNRGKVVVEIVTCIISIGAIIISIFTLYCEKLEQSKITILPCTTISEISTKLSNDEKIEYLTVTSYCQIINRGAKPEVITKAKLIISAVKGNQKVTLFWKNFINLNEIAHARLVDGKKAVLLHISFGNLDSIALKKFKFRNTEYKFEFIFWGRKEYRSNLFIKFTDEEINDLNNYGKSIKNKRSEDFLNQRFVQ